MHLKPYVQRYCVKWTDVTSWEEPLHVTTSRHTHSLRPPHLRCHRVGPRGEQLRDARGVEPALRQAECRPEPGTARSHDNGVVRMINDVIVPRPLRAVEKKKPRNKRKQFCVCPGIALPHTYFVWLHNSYNLTACLLSPVSSSGNRVPSYCAQHCYTLTL